LSAAETTTISLDCALQLICETVLTDPAVRIVGLQRLTGGTRKETWSFDAIATDGSCHPLILRREIPGSPRPADAIAMAGEAAVLKSASKCKVPVPRVISFEDDVSAVGAAYLLTERLDGETIPQRILRSPELAPVLPRLAYDCGAALARIHAIPVGDVPGIGSQSDRLVDCEDDLANFDEAYPAFEVGLRWLSEHRPPSFGPTTVHGDFRNGNLLVDTSGLRAVLDWELVHIGDPAEDLGWLCVNAWRFGSRHPVGGFGGYEDLLTGYADAGGQKIDLRALKWWEALGTLRWGIGCVKQARRHLDGDTSSIELAAIGRLAAHQDLDLLQIITEWDIEADDAY
jgi:aminoglycoside phosphotransferase (APT) family kinase protein